MTDIITRAEAKAQGLKRYFTGKPCKHGHIDTRAVSNGSCRECDRLKALAVNPDAKRKAKREYMARTRERWNEYISQWREENAEHVQAYSKAYDEAHQEEKAARIKEWRKANPEKSAAYVIERQRKCQMGDMTATEWAQLKEIYSERDRLNAEAGCIAFHVDHITPLAKGGAHHPDNLQILSAEENLSKGAKLDFAKVDKK